MTITISPLLLMGTTTTRPAEAIGNAREAAERIKEGHRVIVPDPGVLLATLIHLGAHEDEARAQVLSHLSPRGDLTGLPQP